MVKRIPQTLLYENTYQAVISKCIEIATNNLTITYQVLLPGYSVQVLGRYPGTAVAWNPITVHIIAIKTHCQI